MALKNQTIQEGQVAMGQNGRRRQWGYAEFDGTDVTGELSCNMASVEQVHLTPVIAGQPVAGDQLACAEAGTLYQGVIAVKAGGTLTITRAANTTASEGFFYDLTGF